MKLTALPAAITNKLINTEEDAQGSHIVDITFDDGSVAKNVAVLNGTLAEIPPQFAGKTVTDVQRSNP